MNSNELMHFGVKGMQWGVRRYQNKDGTRTAEGKKRESLGSRAKGAYSNFRSKTSGHYRRAHMTDDELKQRIARLSQEKKLRDLERDIRDEQVKLGEEVGKKIVMAAAMATVSGAIVYTKMKYGAQLNEQMTNILDHIDPGVPDSAKREAYKKNNKYIRTIETMDKMQSVADSYLKKSKK